MKKESINNKSENILGIDPGSTTIGYGVISHKNGGQRAIGYGYIDLKSHSEQASRLLHLNEDLLEIFNKYKPGSIAIENIYFFKNVKTFTSVTQSKGVILLAAAKANIKVYEYTPLQIKQTISGYGKASKDLIQKSIQSSLNISKKIKPDDVSDALAIALCHIRHLIKC